jgi:hypothetical protein
LSSAVGCFGLYMLPLTIDPIGSRNAPNRRGEMSPILYAGWTV